MANPTLTLRLFALGPPEARLGERLLVFPTRKTLALLIYLAIEARAQPREHPCKRPCARQAVRPKPPTFPSQTIRWT
jgi:hypothetical protein